MPDDVILRYKRTGETYAGEIEGGPSFSEASYATMMSLAHRALVARPEARLLMQRTDREGLHPVIVEHQLVELLRTDPVAYIKTHTVPHRTAGRHGETRISKLAQPTMQSHLRVGRETLAAAFGEHIYLRIDSHSSRVEHPATGRWVPASDVIFWLSAYGEAPVHDGDTWLKVSVLALCHAQADRFYMPHPWNEFGTWITKAQLQNKYNKYMKEKEQCLSEPKIP